MEVRAIKRGFFGGLYRRPGSKFDCPSDEFSPNWMEKVTKDIKPLEIDKDYTPLECPSIEAIRAERSEKIKKRGKSKK